MLERLIENCFLHFQLLIFHSGHIVFLNLVGTVSDELVVGKFVLSWLIPTSKTPALLIGLCFRMDVFAFLLYLFRTLLAILNYWCLLSYFFFLVLLLFLFFLLSSISTALFFMTLFLVFTRVSFMSFHFFLCLNFFFKLLFLGGEFHCCFNINIRLR